MHIYNAFNSRSRFFMRPVAWSGVSRLALGAAAAFAVFTAPSRAWSQCNIPAAAATSVQVTPATQDAIRNCAEAARAAFAGDDFAQIKRVRDALLAPLRQARVTAQFRFSLDEALAPVLRDAVRGGNEDAVLNALRIAGELAAVNSVEILGGALANDRPAVRFMAASGLERAFQHIGSEAPPALLALNVMPAVRALNERLAVEADPKAAEGLVLALDAGARIGTQNFDAVALACVEALAGGVGDRVSKGVGADFNLMLLRAADGVASVVTRAGGAGGMRLDERTRTLIARFSGDALTHSACRVQQAGSALDSEERQLLADVVGRAENTYLLISRQLGQEGRGQNLQQVLQQGGRDNVFLAGVLDITGRLARAPFGVDPSRFKHVCK